MNDVLIMMPHDDVTYSMDSKTSKVEITMKEGSLELPDPHGPARYIAQIDKNGEVVYLCEIESAKKTGKELVIKVGNLIKPKNRKPDLAQEGHYQYTYLFKFELKEDPQGYLVPIQ